MKIAIYSLFFIIQSLVLQAGIKVDWFQGPDQYVVFLHHDGSADMVLNGKRASGKLRWESMTKDKSVENQQVEAIQCGNHVLILYPTKEAYAGYHKGSWMYFDEEDADYIERELYPSE